MKNSEENIYRERCSFQRKLDETFPRGAMCAVLEETDGHLAAAYLLASTGRIFCSDARQVDAGAWEYQVLIDPRRANESGDKPIRLWIKRLVPTAAVAGLYEATVVSGPGERQRLLRLNADPPSHVRPPRRMRAAATEAHEADLFPHGLDLARPEAASAQ